MNRIEFVGNAIFIPFFLITVGMLVDLRVLLKGQEALLIAGALTGMALGTKWLAAWISQKIFSYSAVQRNVMFGLSSSHAAATIAVILIGYNMGLVDENVLNGTVILILITCMVGSFVTANAGRKLAVQQESVAPVAQELEDRFLIPILKEENMEELIDFSLLIHDKQFTTPIFPLAVVQDDEEARIQVLKSSRILEKAVAHASAADAKVQVVTRVDLNLSDGIARAVKELMITDLVLPWPETPSTTDRLFATLFGTNMNNILNAVTENIYVCRFHQAIHLARKIVVVVPPNAELEKGFAHWIHKLNLLTKELGAKLIFFSTAKTFSIAKELLRQRKGSVDIFLREIDGFDEMLLVHKEVGSTDLLVVVKARKGTISYVPDMEQVSARINKHFSDKNVLLIYPEQLDGAQYESVLKVDDITLTPIDEQIRNINRIGKAVKRIFKGKDRN